MYHIVYGFDVNYQQHFAASLNSLVKSFTKDRSLLCIHIITDKLNDELYSFVATYAVKKGLNIQIHELSNEFLNLIDIIPEKFKTIKGYINTSTYFRLLISLILGEEVGKAVYVDSDTILISDISDLFSIDLCGNSIGAVIDVDNDYMSKMHNLSAYYNAGLLVMNLEKLRAKDFSKNTIGYIASENCAATMGDQCAINIVMKGDIFSISEKWNRFASNSEYSISLADVRIKGAALIHFISAYKPWHAWYANKLGDLYWDNLRESGWPNPKLKAPETVNEYKLMARKLSSQKKYAESIEIYEKMVGHLISKIDQLKNSN